MCDTGRMDSSAPQEVSTASQLNGGAAANRKDLLDALAEPAPYAGLYGFHKYWGKKPAEPLRYLMGVLSDDGGLVCDPFLGSGAVAREAAVLGRRFVGGDLNPLAVRLSRFLVSPCDKILYAGEIQRIEKSVKHLIDESYGAGFGTEVSHVLWKDGAMAQVWERPSGKRTRIEREPVPEDGQRFEKYESHTDIGTRPLCMFDDTRINSKSTMTWRDLFTGRAMRNIKLLRDAISESPEQVREALELTLTASMGQMSKMVFAISSRGKNNGRTSSRVEVGSWVIGYWRPKIHFEVNVWNCFASKARKLARNLPETDVLFRESVPDLDIRLADANNLVSSIEDESLDLLITDPPHGDRIPYLELSELWNAALGLDPDREAEIVVSNAKGRRKDVECYDLRMGEFLETITSKIKPAGAIALFFNSRKKSEWSFIKEYCESGMDFTGAFPMNYSANSVAQDNRKGGLKTDHVLIFSKGQLARWQLEALQAVPNWMDGAFATEGMP